MTSLLLNPCNAHQLVVGSLDGLIRLWDYREGRLLRTLDLGAPVHHACGHASLPDQLFVALEATDLKPDPADGGEPKSRVYSISLRPKALEHAELRAAVSPATARSPARRVRLAQPRVVRALAVSPSGQFLLAMNPHQINILRTAHLQGGFVVHLDSAEPLTALAFHPTDNYFATGNAKGQIRLWYDVLDADDAINGAGAESDKEDAVMTKRKGSKLLNRPATAVFHWHAHPVASIAFTPNGAYLLSGGEESVVVLWQLHTGHKEFVPRVGAPVLTLSITNGVQSEQQIAARLRDGSVIFIGSQKLKIHKTISGLKADPVRLTDLASRPAVRVPLAVQPLTKNLVLPAGHPSSIQFYSPAEDAQALELEVSPSNRVSSASTQIEPTRVDMVAFSTPASAGRNAGSYWMATVDSWANGHFTPSRHLKLWHHRSDQSGFILATRIDRPHDAPITSVSFSPNAEQPLLLTTSTDGTIKIWALVNDGWQCRTSIAYRGFCPIDAAWSQDGSMFAVAHSRSVTLWSLASASLIHAFPCAAIAPARSVEFTNAEGTSLLAGGQHGTVVFDLLTFEETFTLAFEVGQIAPKPKSSLFVATEKSAKGKETEASGAEAHAFLVDSSKPTCETRPLPFPVRQALWLEGGVGDKADSVSLAVVDENGGVSLLGQAARVGGGVAASRLPNAATGQSKLFDELFGAEEADRKSAVKQARKVAAAPRASTSVSLEVLDTPAHSLPPVRLLWRTMLGDFAVPQAKEETASKGKGGKAPRADEDVEMGDGEKAEQEEAVEFSPSPAALADIFKRRLVLGGGAGAKGTSAGKGTPGKKGGQGTPSRSASKLKA